MVCSEQELIIKSWLIKRAALWTALRKNHLLTALHLLFDLFAGRFANSLFDERVKEQECYLCIFYSFITFLLFISFLGERKQTDEIPRLETWCHSALQLCILWMYVTTFSTENTCREEWMSHLCKRAKRAKKQWASRPDTWCHNAV